MADFIPKADPEFNDWFIAFCDYFIINFAALGFTSTEKNAIQAAKNSWVTDYGAHITEQNTASGIAHTKSTTRANGEALVRQLSGTMQSNPVITDAQKAALDITIPKTTKTPSSVPTTRPIGKVDNRNRLEHIISFFDEATPNSKAKPAGVRACEIWEKIGGAAPTGPQEVTYVVADTKTPYNNTFPDSDAGKTVHYMLRWVNTRNEPGPWSETISVTISA